MKRAAACRRTVLVADNDRGNLRLLEHHLTEAGYHVHTAAHGSDAIRLLREIRPWMVVASRDMREITGLAICRQVRASEDSADIYVVVHGPDAAPGEESETQEDSGVAAAWAAGADDYIATPFESRELVARLRAGERILTLERSLIRRNDELCRARADLETAYDDLAQANRKLGLNSGDELTGLADRRAAMKALEEQWRTAGRRGTAIACIILGVDRLDEINAAHGREVGDAVLRVIASTIEHTTRGTEQVFRLDHAKLLVLCPKATAAMATRGAARMRAAIETLEIPAGDATLSATVSIGIAEHCPAMRTHDHLVAAAEEAWHDARAAGGNCVRISPTAPHAIKDGGDEKRASA